VLHVISELFRDVYHHLAVRLETSWRGVAVGVNPGHILVEEVAGEDGYPRSNPRTILRRVVVLPIVIPPDDSLPSLADPMKLGQLVTICH